MNTRTFIRVSGVILLMLLMLASLHVVQADAAVSLNVPTIKSIGSELKYEFDISVSGLESGSTANIILATYDDDGICKSKIIKSVTSEGISVELPYSKEETSYKLMLIDENTELLKPLCPAVSGELKWSYESLVINSDDIKSWDFDSYELEYYVDYENSSKTNVIKLDSDIECLYNKASLNLTELYDLVSNNSDIILEFEKFDSDNYYDALSAVKYVYDVVDSADKDNSKLYLRNTGTITFDFDSEDTTAILVDEKENSLTLSDFAEGDVVAILSDGNNPKNYIEYIKVINITELAIEGMVSESYTANDYSYVGISDNLYRVSDGVGEIPIATEGIFYIGITGKIIYVETIYDAPDYGYILSAGISQSVFSQDFWQIMLLTEHEGVVTYSLTENANEDLVYYLQDNGLTEAVDSGKWLWETAGDRDASYRLVTYKTNSLGQIKEITDADANGTTDKSDYGMEYNAQMQKLGSVYLEDDVIIFNVSSQNTEDAYAADVTALADEGIYYGLVHSNENDECAVVVITSQELKFPVSDGLAIATRVSRLKNADGDDIIKVTYLKDGIEGSVIFDDNSVCIGYTDFTEINVGDAFVFLPKKTGMADMYAVVAQVSEDSDENKIFKTTIDSSALGSDIAFLNGYISNESYKSNSRGEIITINNSGAEEIAYITENTNIYIYDNVGRYPMAKSCDDLISENVDYFDPENNTATMVFANTCDGMITDIYALNQRMDITSMTPVENESAPVKRNETVIEINTDNISNITSRGLTYEYYTEEGIERLTVNDAVTLIINTMETAEITDLSPASLMENLYCDFGSDTAMIEFTDTDSDGYYDLLTGTSYVSGVIDAIDVSKGRLAFVSFSRAQTITFDFEDEGATIIFADSKGSELTLDDFKVGDIVSVSADASTPKRYNDYIKVIKVVDSTVTGTIEEIYNVGDKNYIVISGNEYESKAGEFPVGTKGSFYIDIMGKVCYADIEDTTKHGYILSAAIGHSTFSEDRWEIMLLTEDEGVVIYNLTEDANAYFTYYLQDNGLTEAIDSDKWLWETAGDRDASYRLITYELNAKGQITELGYSGNTYTLSEGAEYNATMQKIDGSILEDDVIIFNVDVNDAEDAYIASISLLVDGGIYCGFIHRNNSGENTVMVITGRDIKSSEEVEDEVDETEEVEVGFAIVSKLSASKDEDGNDVTKVNYVQNEEEGVLIFNDDSVCKGEISFICMSVGDVFMYNADLNGVVSEYSVIAQIVKNNVGQKEIQLVVDRDFLGGNTKLYGGYIINAVSYRNNKGEAIHIGDIGEEMPEYEAFITENTNKYSYVDVGRNIVIETGDFMAEDAFYREVGVTNSDGAEVDLYTPVIVRAVDDEVIDIYTSNDRIQY